MKSNSTLFTIVCITALIYFYGGQSAVQDAYDKAQSMLQVAGLAILGVIVVGFCIFALYRLAKHIRSEIQWKLQQPTYAEWLEQQKLKGSADLLAALKQSMAQEKYNTTVARYNAAFPNRPLR